MQHAEFEQGNRRLREMWAELLEADTYEYLVEQDVDGLLSFLADSSYRPDIEAASHRTAGLRCLFQALRLNLTRSLHEVRDSYKGGARRAIELLFTRWDVQNLLTIFRGLACGVGGDDVRRLIVPAGFLDGAMLSGLMQQPDLLQGLELLLGWRRPHCDAAAAMLQSWRRFEETSDLRVLEHRLMHAYASFVDRELHPDAPGAPALRLALFAEVDQVNLLNVLRRRTNATAEHEPSEESLLHLPGGRLSDALLDQIAKAKSRQDVLDLLTDHEDLQPWRAALEGWVVNGDLMLLTTRLWESLVRQLVALYRHGDPAGIDLPVAYAAAKENEIRNLRLVGFGAFTGMPSSSARERIVIL